MNESLLSHHMFLDQLFLSDRRPFEEHGVSREGVGSYVIRVTEISK